MSRSTINFNNNAGSSGGSGSDVDIRREIETFILDAPVVANTTQIVIQNHNFYDLDWVDVTYENIELDTNDFVAIAPNIVQLSFDDPGVSILNQIRVTIKYVYRA